MKALNFGKIEKKNIYINVFWSENNLVYPVHILDKKFKDYGTNENKSHVYIKDFNRFMCSNTKNNKKNTFASIVYNVLVVYHLRFMLILIKKFSKDKLLDSCDVFSSLKD